MLKPAEQLIKEAEQKKQEELSINNKKELEIKQFRKQHQQEQINKAEKLLNEVLPALLEKASKNGIREIVYPNRGIFDANCSLDFFDPSTRHCRLILDSLKTNGYKVEVLVLVKQNYNYKSYGDGEYDLEYAPGTHNEYQLKIEW